MRKCDVGGQAVIEGVMMRGSKGIATAIRTSKGNIKVSVKKTVPLTKKYKILSLPFIRGITALLDSLIIGIKTLNYSASFFEDEEEVIQYHPKKSQYVNLHENCLHMWRPVNRNIITPPIYKEE